MNKQIYSDNKSLGGKGKENRVGGIGNVAEGSPESSRAAAIA